MGRFAWTSRLLIGVAGLVVLTACEVGRPGYTYRYRLTLSVLDHGKASSASSVVEVTEHPAWKGPYGLPFLAFHQVCGEATVLPLRNGKYLLALLSGGSYPEPGDPGWRITPTQVLLHHLQLNEDWTTDPSGIKALASGSKMVSLTRHEDLPGFVVVADKDNPLSFRGSPWPSLDPEWLGDGIFFKSLTIQATTDSVTSGAVPRAFPWLRWYNLRHRLFQNEVRMGFTPQQFQRCD